MPDLNTQLREYFDATAPPLEFDATVTDEVWVPARNQTRPRARMVPAWAYGLGALVLVLVVTLGLSVLWGGYANEVVEPTPTTPLTPDVETMTDLQIIEAGVAAVYSGDAERAVELFGIEDSPVWRDQGGYDDAQMLDDKLIRRVAAYQAAIGGRLTLNCTDEVNTPGMFTCNVPYHNALTDAVGYVDSPGDFIRVVVQDGVITQFGLPGHLDQGVAHEFPEHNFLQREVEPFLRQEVEGSEGCWDDIQTPECARLIMDHLDEWAAWCGHLLVPLPHTCENRTLEIHTPTPTAPVTNPTLYSILDGEVTFAAAPPWRVPLLGDPGIPDGFMKLEVSRDDHVVIATDPLRDGTGCEKGSPADAEAMARRIMADPHFETTEPVPVRIAGMDGLQVDVDAARGDPNAFCWGLQPDQAEQWRMRLYLLDYPGESAAVLTIAVIASPEFSFERVLEQATPIVESLEIHID